MQDEPLWTTEDVARFLSVSQTTVRSWQQGHRVPFVKIGGTIRFIPADIRQWVAEHGIPLPSADGTCWIRLGER